MKHDIIEHVRTCDRCQKGKRSKRKYGKVPEKLADVIPWRKVCVDLIGPYTIKGKDGTILDFMCLTMIDPATAWFEIVELPIASVTTEREGETITKIVIDKSSAQISKLFNKQWLCCYPRPVEINYDNGSEFKLYFRELCDSYSIKRKPTTVKNPRANAVLERVHGVFGDMMRTAGLDMSETVNDEMVDSFIDAAAWAICSTHHTVLGMLPGAAVFGRDMLFDIPHLADWKAIGERRQHLVSQNNLRENLKRVDYDWAVGDKCLIIQDEVQRKASDINIGPWVVTTVHTNGTVKIQRDTVTERMNIRRLRPYFSA